MVITRASASSSATSTQADTGDIRPSDAQERCLPVTLVSGFLGSGKTTLLKNILTAKHGLGIAVIVNDIGEINIDGMIIGQDDSFTRTQEKPVELENGCICCTLRGDLLEELVKLGRKGKFDYIVIESSGISEPQQVAETFDPILIQQITGMEGLDEKMAETFNEMARSGGLSSFARLDTCVTVVDACSMKSDFATVDFLSARREDTQPEDERSISELLVDQIEFANVIILNKVYLVSKPERASIREVIRGLNRDARVIETNFSRVDVKEIVNTGTFEMDKAQVGAGWLADLNELSKIRVNGKMALAPKAETEEYGITNFVYSRRRPFHPRRLWELVKDTFVLADTTEGVDDDDEDDEETSMDDATNNADGTWAEKEDEEFTGFSDSDESDPTTKNIKASPSSPYTPDTATCSSNSNRGAKYEAEEDEEERKAEYAAILSNKLAHPLFSKLYRSKGGYWLATRPNQSGSWSQAGVMLTLEGGHFWFCLEPESEWGAPTEDVLNMMRADQEGKWGDRQQQIVFIGERLDRAGIEESLDGCLLNDEEMRSFEQVMDSGEGEEAKIQSLRDLFDDGFPTWGAPGHGHDHEHDHEHGHEHGDDVKMEG